MDMAEPLIGGRCAGCRRTDLTPVSGKCALEGWSSTGWVIGSALALVGIHAIFAAVQFALAKGRSGMLESKAKHAGSRFSGKMAERSAGRTELYVSLCQLMMTLCGIALGMIAAGYAGRTLAPWLGETRVLGEAWAAPVTYIGVFIVVVVIQISLGELIPKLAALRKPERVLWLATVPLSALMRLLSPVVACLHRFASAVLRRFGFELREEPARHAEEELRSMLEESRRNGLIDAADLAMVDNLLNFTETTAREIMIPRTEMICLKSGLSLKANKTIAIQYMRTRYPVCEHDKDNIIGFVHIKDLLKESFQQADSINAMIRPVTTVPEGIPISTLMGLMQKKRSQIAILIDEYGGTSGLVTLEDIMEEIVGDIQDEFDVGAPDIVKEENGNYSVSGLLLIEEINSYFGLSIPSDEFETIGGWLYPQLQSPPAPLQSVAVGQLYEFQVLETRHLRIARIAVKKLEGKGESEEGGKAFGKSDIQ